MVRLLIERGANVRVRDYTGRTPLHWTSSIEAAKLLLGAGANINALDDGGNTPLDIARDVTFNGYSEFLLTRGAKTSTELQE